MGLEAWAFSRAISWIAELMSGLELGFDGDVAKDLNIPSVLGGGVDCNVGSWAKVPDWVVEGVDSSSLVDLVKPSAIGLEVLSVEGLRVGLLRAFNPSTQRFASVLDSALIM